MRRSYETPLSQHIKPTCIGLTHIVGEMYYKSYDKILFPMKYWECVLEREGLRADLITNDDNAKRKSQIVGTGFVMVIESHTSSLDFGCRTDIIVFLQVKKMPEVSVQEI